LGMLKLPALSVVAVRSKPLTGLRMLTVAFGTTAPDESTTVPEIEVEPAVCAIRTAGSVAVHRHRTCISNNLLILAMAPLA
jgi:hypothetical protein